MSELLNGTTDADSREHFLEQLADDYAVLRSNPEAWAQELAERAEWDATLLDGLKNDVYCVSK